MGCVIFMECYFENGMIGEENFCCVKVVVKVLIIF